MRAFFRLWKTEILEKDKTEEVSCTFKKKTKPKKQSEKKCLLIYTTPFHQQEHPTLLTTGDE